MIDLLADGICRGSKLLKFILRGTSQCEPIVVETFLVALEPKSEDDQSLVGYIIWEP